MRGVTTGLAGRADVTVAASVPASVPAYAVAGLSKTYRSRRDGGAVLANDDVSLSVGQGEIFGLLGPNGAGKSTLVRHLVGLLRPDRGRVLLLGDEVTGRPQRAARAVAYLAQHEPALDEIPVSLAVETTGRLRGLSRPAARAARDVLLTELGLEAVAGRPLGQVSGGQRRLAAVATALVADRPVLVLDEPTTGLDPTARRAVWSALDRRRQLAGTTVVLVTHNVLEAENVLDRVAVLDVGRVIACDTPGRLKARYGGDVRLDLVWREPPPAADATVNLLRARAQVVGRRWSVSLPVGEARAALGRITDGPAFAALDDFTLATPTLEEVYLALGGTADDLERQ